MERMGPFAPRGTDKHFDKKDFVKTLTAWQFWAFAYAPCLTLCRHNVLTHSLCYFFMTNSLNAFGYFAPTIIANLGFKGCK